MTQVDIDILAQVDHRRTQARKDLLQPPRLLQQLHQPGDWIESRNLKLSQQVIYGFMSRNFRQSFSEALCKCRLAGNRSQLKDLHNSYSKCRIFMVEMFYIYLPIRLPMLMILSFFAAPQTLLVPDIGSTVAGATFL